MDLFEYQARDLFEAHGVPVLPGLVATTPEEARAAAEQLGPASTGRSWSSRPRSRWAAAARPAA